METTGNYVAYYRVSTDRQGQSGLGLDAQRAAVANYMNDGDWKLLDTFTEVESGRKNDRPELAKALELCRRRRATLVIAKLDRLARNVAFIANLMDANVDLIAVDMPQANRLTLHIMAAMAEHEAAAVSQRTGAALQAAKERGRKLGWSRYHRGAVNRPWRPVGGRQATRPWPTSSRRMWFRSSATSSAPASPRCRALPTP